MDLASATADLYGGSLDDFIERRKALAAEARAAKDSALATAIGKLRKPTRSAWLVNLYAREEPAEVGALLDLGAALQVAQAQLSGPELRRLSAERQKTLSAATSRTIELGRAQGYAATEAVRQEVAQTLQAALADPEVAEQVRTGTVTEAHTYGGFGPFSPELSDAAVARATVESDKSENEGREKDEAERRLQEAETALSAAADEADEATTHADELADRVEALRRQLSEAEAEEAEAAQRARTARKKLSELEATVRGAREAYEAL